MTGISESEKPEIIRTAERFAGNGPVNQLAIVLMKTWGEKDPDSDVAKNPCSYVATFADMARAALTWSESRVTAPGISGQAREEAARRLAEEQRSLGRSAYATGDDYVRADGERIGFVLGAEWAASLNPEPSHYPDLDEMERLLGHYDETAYPAHTELFALIAEVRAARTAREAEERDNLLASRAGAHSSPMGRDEILRILREHGMQADEYHEAQADALIAAASRPAGGAS